jgi:hypothetical protein
MARSALSNLLALAAVAASVQLTAAADPFACNFLTDASVR